MQVGSTGHSHGIANSRMADRAMAMRQEMQADRPTKGEKIVGRLDQNDDAKLSLSELKDTKLGRRMTVDRFARLDGNEDGQLDAAELDTMKRRHHDHKEGPGMAENLVRAKYADYLAEKVEVDDGEKDVAARLLERLDADKSGGLNSEEIAGTRLAEAIGGDFYQIDADKNGALNTQELSDFVVGHLGGETEAAETPEVEAGEVEAGEVAVGSVVTDTVVSDTEAAVAEAADIAAGEVTAPVAGPETVAPVAPAAPPTQAESISTAFETALELLKNGTGSDSPYDVVQALYSNVQNILKAG